MTTTDLASALAAAIDLERCATIADLNGELRCLADARPMLVDLITYLACTMADRGAGHD